MRQEDRSRRTTGQAHPIDVFVGTRIKQRRTEIGISQEMLGKKINLTFQHIQKYERGANRVGSSRLFELAGVLGVSIDYFFDGIPKHLFKKGENSASASPEQKSETDLNLQTYEEGSILTRSETLRLITNYYRIKSEVRRRAIYTMVKDFAEQHDGVEKPIH